MKIILNKKAFNFSDEYLPLLIHGQTGSGASFLSLALISALIKSGKKVLFISKFPKAVDQLTANLKTNFNSLTTLEDLNHRRRDNVIIIESGNSSMFLRALDKLSDLEERIVFIKNFETVLTPEIWARLRKFNMKAILSGNLDESVLQKTDFFKTRIIFNPTNKIRADYPTLDKYQAYFSSEDKTGILTVKK